MPPAAAVYKLEAASGGGEGPGGEGGPAVQITEPTKKLCQLENIVLTTKKNV